MLYALAVMDLMMV